jgi:arylsulfatase A-like enzyme
MPLPLDAAAGGRNMPDRKGTAPMSKRALNLIILSSDEMRGDCPGFMGNPDCKTPNLDRFAERGVVFRNHFTVHGKCVPSRIAAMTGRYCHTDGFRTIQQHLPNDQPDLLSALKARGYESALFGHDHCWENIYGEGRNAKGSSFVDYHSFTDGRMRGLLERQWPSPPPGPDAAEPMDLEDGYDYRGRITRPLDFFCDDNRAEQAIEFMTRARDRTRPFFMQLNLSWPHPVYHAPEPHFSMYDRAALHAWPHALPQNAPLPLVKMRQIRTGLDAPGAALREVQAVYYAMITKTDAVLGRVLDSIEAAGLFEDSIVMVWVDHGDFAGQYGLVEKWDTYLGDCLMHVPQILYAPGLPRGHVVEGLTEHTDLAPTLLEVLGIEPSWLMHGQSLLPAIEGGEGKTAVFADGGHEEEMWGRFGFEVRGKDGSGRLRRHAKQQVYAECPETMARAKMVRTERWKLVVRLSGGNELYDLDRDPWELNNLYGRRDLSRVVCDLERMLIEWCLRTDTDRPFQPEVGA